MNKEILNKIQDEQDYSVRITFEVICDSHTSMAEGKSIKERALSYVDECTDAMDDSMRHWGDHSHDIEPMKVELYDEDENLIDVTDDILEGINPDAIPETLNNLIKDVKKYVIELNKNIPILMNMPDILPSQSKVDYGKNLHDYKPQYGDPKYWTYPKGVEEKIEDDKLYRVWYTSSDAADPSDSTIWNKVQYITYVPTEKTKIKAALTNIINILTFGK